MRFLLFLTFPILFVAAIACAKPGNQAANAARLDPDKPLAANALPVDDAPRISLADAKKAFDDGTAVIIDVRDEAAYKQEHIKGSLNIPTATLDAKVKEIPKGKMVIAYCS